jgi:hypothetical protein
MGPLWTSVVLCTRRRPVSFRQGFWLAFACGIDLLLTKMSWHGSPPGFQDHERVSDIGHPSVTMKPLLLERDLLHAVGLVERLLARSTQAAAPRFLG